MYVKNEVLQIIQRELAARIAVQNAELSAVDIGEMVKKVSFRFDEDKEDICVQVNRGNIYHLCFVYSKSGAFKECFKMSGHTWAKVS
jgi:hypothetical protein